MPSKWHLLGNDMLYQITNKLDFSSYENFRRCSKDLYQAIQVKNYYKIPDQHECDESKKINIFVTYLQRASCWLGFKKKVEIVDDVDTYTRKMIFFSRHNIWKAHTLLSEAYEAKEKVNQEANNTNNNLYEESAALLYLDQLWDTVQKKKPIHETIFQLYAENDLERMFAIYVQDFQRNTRGWTTPYEYCSGTQIIRFILHNSMNINFQNAEGNTLLHCAKSQKQYQYLLNHPYINLNIENVKGETPLHYAIANPTRRLYGGSFHVYKWIDEWHLAKKLLEDPRTDVHIKNKEGKTPLHYAAQFGSDDKGGNLLQTEITGFSILQLLVAQLNDKDLLVKDNEGQTVLHVAIRYKRRKVIKYLINRFPSLRSVQYSENKTFLDYAYENNIKITDEVPQDSVTILSQPEKLEISQGNKSSSILSLICQYRTIWIIGALVSIGSIGLYCEFKQNMHYFFIGARFSSAYSYFWDGK